ncbi:XRE family transcriptional regulator [Streptomyces roseoverticillatus]|uniref:XRE family transcriptional regulator n=1 Tax=Streptomyces roseoverticillatus TaxID=66429 RepID=UPI0033C82CE9
MHLLTRALRARGWLPPEFARRICALGDQRHVAVGTGKDGVYRWQRGRNPDLPTQYLIAELLGIPASAVVRYPWPRWDPLQQPNTHSWDAPGAIQALEEVSGKEIIEMQRRQFTQLTGVALTASLWAWLTANPAAAGQIAQGSRLGEAAVAHIEERVRQLRHADDIDGGGQLLDETSSSLRMVTTLLKDRSYTDAHGARLHGAAADLARMHAWALFDVEDTCADIVFQAVLRAAHASADPALGSHVLAFWAIAAYNSDRAADAEEMTAAAFSASRGRSTYRVEAMLLSRRARARAHQKNTAAFADLDRAADLLATADRHHGEDPEWVAWLDQAELLGAQASTHLDLDEPTCAEQLFSQTARLFPTDRIRTQALFLARQADAQWRQADPERACATAHRALALDLDEEISSHRAAGPLRDLATSMRTHTAIPAVKDPANASRPPWPRRKSARPSRRRGVPRGENFGDFRLMPVSTSRRPTSSPTWRRLTMLRSPHSSSCWKAS